MTNMKKKPYDFLDQRKTEFELDFDEFKRMVAELHQNIQMFMDQKFEKIVSTTRALVLLQRFEKLNLPGLGIYDKYQRILSTTERTLRMCPNCTRKTRMTHRWPEICLLLLGR